MGGKWEPSSTDQMNGVARMDAMPYTLHTPGIGLLLWSGRGAKRGRPSCRPPAQGRCLVVGRPSLLPNSFWREMAERGWKFHRNCCNAGKDFPIRGPGSHTPNQVPEPSREKPRDTRSMARREASTPLTVERAEIQGLTPARPPVPVAVEQPPERFWADRTQVTQSPPV